MYLNNLLNLYNLYQIIFLQDFKTPKSELQFAYVHFIDRGYGNWMSTVSQNLQENTN